MFLNKTTSLMMNITSLIQLQWEMHVYIRLFRKRTLFMPKKTLQRRTASRLLNSKRNLLSLTAGKWNRTFLSLYRDLDCQRIFSTAVWLCFREMKKLKFFLLRHYSEILILYFLMSLQTTLILMLFVGWRSSYLNISELLL